MTSDAYIVNIHGSHSSWKQGALGAAVSGIWAGAGPQRAARSSSSSSSRFVERITRRL